jgi:hypothetical protein
MELVFNNYDSWCDFCQPEQMFWMQMRIAIPVYLFLPYVPAILRSIARRDARQFHRIVIALMIYALFITAYIFAIGGSDARDDLQLAAKWLLTLLAAAGVAWSNVSGRLKAAAISLVLLLGTWTLPFTRNLIAPKFDEALAYFVSYLVPLSFGVGVTLWLTWVTERGFESWRRGRLEPEAS